MPLVWQETMSCGHPGIDRDHKALIALVNALEEAIAAGAAEAALAPLLTRLRDDTARHFAREEAVQRACRFPLAHPHHCEHQDLLAQLDGLIERHVVNRSAPLDGAAAADIHRFIAAWVIDHMIMDDLRMQPFVASDRP